MSKQQKLEFIALIYLIAGLVVAALIFVLAPNTNVFAQLSSDTGGLVTNEFFAGLCGLGLILALRLPHLIDNSMKRAYFTGASFPFVAYAFAVIDYAIRAHSNGLTGPFFYLLLFFSNVLISLAVYRDVS